jgi:hypothetical protein
VMSSGFPILGLNFIKPLLMIELFVIGITQGFFPDFFLVYLKQIMVDTILGVIEKFIRVPI